MNDGRPKYSIIVPVFNRVDEVRELLTSLCSQTFKDFEIVVVEDGSTEICRDVCLDSMRDGLNVQYFYKQNEGRSIARNYGMERALGQFFVFFDSDCVIPSDYLKRLDDALSENPLDCFGGPDAAHKSFTNTQKAINYSMTSFLTTGGIRGGKVSLEKFVPRTFNMGFSRTVYEKVGGFREMFSEDIDMSTRIRLGGFTIGLIDNPVWHKRRVDFKKFFRQVYVFGKSRITLKLLYPDSLKLVHTLPALFVVGFVALVLLGLIISPLFLVPLLIYLIAIFIGALVKTHSLKIAFLAVPSALIQLGGYGMGFIRDFMLKIVLRQGRNLDEEIEMRRGK